MYKLWVNVDQDDNIMNGYGGFYEFVGEPLEQYDYYFKVTVSVYKSIRNYKVINGELIERA